MPRCHLATLPLILLLFLTVLSGCSLGSGSELEIPVAEFLPADWGIVGEWQEVNIDSDTSPEYLIFFAYNSDNVTEPDNAPVGALIYDSQADVGQGVDFKSYRILPAYRAGTGQGFVAEPAHQEEIEIFPVTRTEPGEVRPAPGDAVLTTTVDVQSGSGTDELVIFGGDTTLTVVWWQGAGHGYGVTQIYAPGGLHNINDPTGQTDEAWTGNAPITFVRGDFPLGDRSLLCYEKRYVRTLDPDATPPDAYRPSVRYQETPMGLRFCYATPAHPFYPEGVVLAYLLDPSPASRLLHPDLSEPERERITQRIVDLADTSQGRVRVEDLKAYRTVEPAEGVDTSVLTTSACATILSQQNGSAALLFTLRQPLPDSENRMTDQFYITSVNEIPAPTGGPAVQCGDIIDNGVPERRWTSWY